jgi:diguanylate cyclase (GGDEF)-like protein
MPIDGGTQPGALDMPTLIFVAVCIAAMLGLFLVFTWLQQRSVRALAWWGSAYLIGASSMALWSAPNQVIGVPPELPAALIFVACGMFWNGVRLFHERRTRPFGTFAGAFLWLLGWQLPGFSEASYGRIAFGALIVAAYTFAIAFELGRERRKSLYSPTAAILVPSLHATVFLLPLIMRALAPDLLAGGWLMAFAMQTIVYAVASAFIVLLMVKDHYVHVYRSAATTDPLTGLLNRRGFEEAMASLCAHQAQRKGPVTVLMFDLDHFKSINDRFGHAVGDDVLCLFANVAGSNTRANDIIARFGGEEFAIVIPADMETAAKVGERLRAGFQAAAVAVSGHAIGATVSIGAATSHAPVADIGTLLARADAALYRAKNDGRNRLFAAGDGNADGKMPRAAAMVRDAGEERATSRPKVEFAA